MNASNRIQPGGFKTERLLRFIRAPLDSRVLQEFDARIKGSANEPQDASCSTSRELVQELLK